MFVAILKGMDSKSKVRSNENKARLKTIIKIQEAKISLGNYYILLYAGKNIMKVCNEQGSIGNPHLIVNPNPMQIKAGATHRMSIGFEILQDIVIGTKADIVISSGTAQLPCKPLTVFYHSII